MLHGPALSPRRPGQTGGSPLRIGVLLLAARFPGQSDGEVLTATVDAAIAAEKAGFDDVWFAEHHFMTYGICPSAMTLAAFTLGGTSRITVGTAVSVLPVWRPVALAEQAALLDQVSQAASRRRFCSPRVPTLLPAGSKMIEGLRMQADSHRTDG